jgi:hypothetical protein
MKSKIKRISESYHTSIMRSRSRGSSEIDAIKQSNQGKFFQNNQRDERSRRRIKYREEKKEKKKKNHPNPNTSG